jgi:hypothetical protein
MNRSVSILVRTAAKAAASLAVALALPGLWLAPAALAQNSYENYTFITLAGQAAGWCDGSGGAARLNTPFAVAADTNGNLYVADCYNHVIRKITAAGAVTTFAGKMSTSGSANGTSTTARFSFPVGVTIGSGGTLYVADYGNSMIRKVTSAGSVSTLAGTAGSSGRAHGTELSFRILRNDRFVDPLPLLSR